MVNKAEVAYPVKVFLFSKTFSLPFDFDGSSTPQILVSSLPTSISLYYLVCLVVASSSFINAKD